ncbi:hypothetical protein FF38_04164 [Lucilia cuprina]|uniref:Uncharacterized protein n=1 Tax=Lucilia cuprina TaxID=7375 RepID=A0A0L0C520_LUCCU|nr:hypothetical protein FF38_04164 [Lucilia cuprina]
MLLQLSASLSDTHVALRTVTGCLQITSEHYLQEETKILQVKEHNVMMIKQFLMGFGHFPEACQEGSSYMRGKYMQIGAGFTRSVLVFGSLQRHSYRRYKFRVRRIPHECRTWMSPTAQSRHGRKPAALIKSISGTTQIRLIAYWSRIVRAVPNECSTCSQLK